MRNEDVATFNAEAHRESVYKMAERKEEVHSAGRQTYQRTGQLDKSVNIFGSKRESRNAMVANPDGTCTLAKGIKLPIVSLTDGTGSMGENVGKAFLAMDRIHSMISGFQNRYQIDLSVAVVQDVDDTHPVMQMGQFESDNRAAEAVRMLIPDKNGGDSDEDYDLGLWYLNYQVEADITRYDLKGYIFLIADACGRGIVTEWLVRQHLGFDTQGNESTANICQKLFKKWHLFFIQVKGSPTATNWWVEQIGKDRIVCVENPDLLAEVQAGLIYTTETKQPTIEGLAEYLAASGQNKTLSKSDVLKIWKCLQETRLHFGDQANLPNYDKIPLPGSIFANYRDVWPIGQQPIESENASKTEVVDTINWNSI